MRIDSLLPIGTNMLRSLPGASNLMQALPGSSDLLQALPGSTNILQALPKANETLSQAMSSLTGSAPDPLTQRTTPLTAGEILHLPTQPINGNAGMDFAAHVTQAINHLNDLQQHANTLTEQVATGKVEDTYKAMIAMEQASLAFDYTLEVRNKVLDAYQQIMQTQV